MNSNRLRIVGVSGLALTLAFFSVSGHAGSEGKPPKDGFTKLVEAKFGGKVNDYSDMGADYGDSSGDASSNASPEPSADPAETANVSTDDLVVGHEQFNGNCAQCHGEDGVGSTFAPSLVKRLQGMDKATFIDVVTNGKTVFNSSTGSYSVMPAWAANKNVMAHINQIWAYLKARSNGELGTGRPK
jgi:mono/diheme cytochrome c family protein